MLLFKKRFHAGLVDGVVTITFRRWDKPHVRVGGRYRCHPIGVLEVDRVDRIRVKSITENDAKLGGFVSKKELVEYMQTAREDDVAVDDETEVYRIELHHGGDGDRVELALEDNLSPADVDAIAAKLARLDAKQAWTRETLALIDKHPHVAASQLALKVGRATLPFKVDVRKLKKLGLTQSFEVGYEVSPRGRAFLALAGQRKSAPAKRAQTSPQARMRK